MTRREYRALFDATYPSVEDVFLERDDRFVIDQLTMFFGFSEPLDYFELPHVGRLTIALGNFDEAFRVGGISEFLENCGYCVPEMPDFLCALGMDEIGVVFRNILSSSNPAFWGRGFFENEPEVTECCRAKNWFRNETQRLQNAEASVMPELRAYLKENLVEFRDYKF